MRLSTIVIRAGTDENYIQLMQSRSRGRAYKGYTETDV